MRRNGAYLVVVGAGAVALTVTGEAAPGPAGPVAAKGWEAPVLVSATRGSLETSLAVNPRTDRELLVCGPSGVPAVFDHQSHFHRSVDGGRTWSYVDVETAVTDTRQATLEGGDCDVAYDAGGTMWAADTWAGNLSVGHSRDGVSWEGTAVATDVPVVDRPWIVGGPPGTLYVTFHDAQCCTPSVMWFTKTTDYGKTFSPAVRITSATPEGAFTWEGNVEVAPGGKDIYLVYSRRVLPFEVVRAPVEITLASSHDGGATWSSRVVATIERRTSTIYPSIGRDAGGYLHVVWGMERDYDAPVFYTVSKDGGTRWSAPRALNAGQRGAGAWVAGGKKGQARIAWLGSPYPAASSDWYFYYAKVDGSRTTVGTTTRGPVWVGSEPGLEFEMVRLDKKGRMHLGMSVYVKEITWGVYYQREKL